MKVVAALYLKVEAGEGSGGLKVAGGAFFRGSSKDRAAFFFSA